MIIWNGFYSSWKKIKRADTDGFLVDTSHFHFSIRSPPVDTSSCPAPNEKIHFLNATHALTMLPNLNLPEKNINTDFGTTTSIFQGKLASVSDQNCHYSPTKEPQCATLQQSSLGTLAVSGEKIFGT